MAMDIDTHVALGLHRLADGVINGRSNADIIASLNHPADRVYNPCAEALAKNTKEEAVALGTITAYPDWQESSVYPNTVRDLWLYTPADTSEPAESSPSEWGLLIFNDGAGYLNEDGPVRATRVLDRLIARGETPPCVAVFINPGRPPGTAPMFSPNSEAAIVQRRNEYDAITPDYGRFLLQDVLPFLQGKHDLSLTEDPARRLVAGISSGGICAFNTAWHHPDSFARVLSHCGSYTNILGGHNYPYLIRTTPRKALKIYLQSGENDANNLFGNWPLANQTMADALSYAGYEFHFEYGCGGHSLRHGGAVFADSLRYLLGD